MGPSLFPWGSWVKPRHDDKRRSHVLGQFPQGRPTPSPYQTTTPSTSHPNSSSALGGPPSPWPPVLPSHAPASRPTPDQRGQVVRKTSPAGYCLTPTVELAKTKRGPIATSGPFFLVRHRIGPSPTEKSIRFSPLSAARLLTSRPRPEALDAICSGPACRMAISRMRALSLSPKKIRCTVGLIEFRVYDEARVNSRWSVSRSPSSHAVSETLGGERPRLLR